MKAYPQEVIPDINLEDPMIMQFENMGYFCVRPIEQGEFKGCYTGLFRFMFTIGVIVGMDMIGYDHRYCYNTIEEAKAGLNEVVMGRVPTGYIKRKG